MEIIIGIAAILCGSATVIIPTLSNTLRKYPDRTFPLNIRGWIFIVSTILAFIFSALGIWMTYNNSLKEARTQADNLQKTLVAIKRESFRINPYDIQIRLTSIVEGIAVPDSIPEFKPIYVEGSIDSVFFRFEFEEVSDHRKENALTLRGDWHRSSLDRGDWRRQSKRNSKWAIRYYAKNIIIGRLEEYAYLYNLNLKSFKFNVPLKNIEFCEGTWRHFVYISIKGRHFEGELDENGTVLIIIKLEDSDLSTAK